MGMWMLVIFIVLLFLAVPIPFAILISSLLSIFASDWPITLLPQRIVTGSDSFTLLAVPFFLLAGELMQYGGLSRRMVRFANALVGHLTGGLAMVTVVAASLFAATSGSAPATTASIGGIMIPEMEKSGYDKAFSVALAAASGPLGQMIPPSIPMVVWAVAANTSITRLFLAGVVPGLMMAFGLMCVSYFFSKKHGYTSNAKKASGKEVILAFKESFWALMCPVIILGGIYGGIFTPTEAAAVAVTYGVFVGVFIYRELKLSHLAKVFSSAVKSTTLVIFVVAAANLFGWIMAAEQLAPQLVQSLFSVTTNKFVLLMILNLLLIVLGCLMDNIAAMVILSSVFVALGAKLGLDPVHLGLIIVSNFAVGQITPPVGYSLFIGASISGMSIEKIGRAAFPFILAELCVVFLLSYFPAIALFLPNFFYN
ncbi:hypothetical protein FACS1894187_22960 [Synergistales bacterium]|nr:hypothetical protein FACS1894187_22960 [Synergistales bacterium]